MSGEGAQAAEGIVAPLTQAEIVTRLRSMAAGRREYARPGSPHGEVLEQEAAYYDDAADVAAGDLGPLYGALPSWRWTDEMEAALKGKSDD
ncbi:hypothetical protein [Enterococcus hirae]|uniref:hypothetical protein n=1 Tax=Enterococcus hirae TaxID=1354 RepID=UPI00136B2EE9|nr:hypothetical protein [Enterococcus hirae]NAE18344.1 hypothetical protein [Enterococcus hirae]